LTDLFRLKSFLKEVSFSTPTLYSGSRKDPVPV
jgi:hypothetical protein